MWELIVVSSTGDSIPMSELMIRPKVYFSVFQIAQQQELDELLATVIPYILPNCLNTACMLVVIS